MPECKRCQKSYSFLSAHGDGMCTACHQQVVADALEDRTTQAKEILAASQATTKEMASIIAGEESPLFATYVTADVREKRSGLLDKVGSMALGTAIGGAVGGLVVARTLFPSELTFSGLVGLLVVTPVHIHIGFALDVPVLSGLNIGLEQIQLLYGMCKANKIGRMTYEIMNCHVSTSLSCLLKLTKLTNTGDRGAAVEFMPAGVSAHGIDFPSSSLSEIASHLVSLGARTGRLPNEAGWGFKAVEIGAAMAWFPISGLLALAIGKSTEFATAAIAGLLILCGGLAGIHGVGVLILRSRRRRRLRGS